MELAELYERAQAGTLLDGLMTGEITGQQGMLVKQVLRDDATGCWEWQGTMHHSGYGCCKVKGKFTYTHIAAYEAFVGPTNGLFILHGCDNPKCCYPPHLSLGTHQDNMDDMKAKGRGRNQHSRKD